MTMRTACLPHLTSRAMRTLSCLLLVLTIAGCRTADVYAPPGNRAMLAETVLGEAELRAPATYIVDERSGRVLFEENSDGLRFPASLTKLMTLYLVFEAIDSGRLSPDDEWFVSADAASRPPSKVGLVAGSTIRVRDAVQALAVRSANDVAAVIAENMAGSEESFAGVMTARARQLGMGSTRFVNASGLPDRRQISTARDMALLARAVRTRFSAYAPVFRTTQFTYLGKKFEATNKLLGVVPGVDGLKTGYIRDSGFHLIATATRGGRSIIVVVLGGETAKSRDARATALIDEYL